MTKPQNTAPGTRAPAEEYVNEMPTPMQLIPYAPGNILRALDEFYFVDPDIFTMDEGRLLKHLRSVGQDIGPRDDSIRARFWYVYDLADYDQRKMMSKEIFAGIMSEPIFLSNYIKNRFKLAWMLCKPTEMKVQDLAIIAAGKRKMAEFLYMDAVDPVTKKIDYKLVAIQIAIYKNMENRVFGLPTQNIKNTNLNLNAEIPAARAREALENKDSEVLRNTLQDLKTQSLKTLPVSASSSGNNNPSLRDDDVVVVANTKKVESKPDE